MSIEECLKVRAFQNDYHRVTVNVLYTSNCLNKILEVRAAKVGITLQQYNVLRILRGQLPHSASNTLIKQRMISSTPDISRLMDRVIRKGWVDKVQNSGDKRVFDLTITDKGLTVLDVLDEEMLLTDCLSPNLTKEEAIQLSALLDKLRGDCKE